MKYLNILLIVLLFGCSKTNNASNKTIDATVNKVRSFVFINSDSLKYYNNKLKNIIDNKNPYHNAIAQYCDGLYYMTVGLHDKAIANLTNAEQIFTIEKNDSLQAYCQVVLGNCYKLSGKEDDAIGKYLKALPFFEKVKNNKLITSIHGNLSETYFQKNDVQKAKNYLAKAKSNQPEDSRLYLSLIHFEANLLGTANKIDSALLIDKKGIYLAVKNNFPDKLSPFYNNMAHCFIQLNNYDSAQFYYTKCIELDSMNGRLQLMADSYAEIANMYGLKNDEKQMLANANYAIRLCDSTQYLRGKFSLYKGFDDYYTKTKNWYKLVAVKDSVQEINKQLINVETEAKIAEYNIEYETSKKEKVILEQKADLQKVTFLSIIAGVVALLLGIIIFGVHKHAKTKKTVAVNEAIQEQNNIKIKAVFESEQTERIRIARDLHDSIGQKLSVLKMYLHNRENDATKSPTLLDETIQEVRNISHNLLPEELNFGLTSAIKSDLEKLKNTGTFKITVDITENDYSIIPLSSSLNILRIFRELTNNLVKHSNAAQIECSMNIVNNKYNLHLKDNGKSIDINAVEKSTGIGWKNIYARIKMLNGKIKINENKVTGNHIHITIPIL